VILVENALQIILFCNILISQRKYTEAKQMLFPCLLKAQQSLGPSHELTEILLNLDARVVRPYF